MKAATGPIRALPPPVADAIAAGEVVERPASVVKELIENAVDAGAARIEVLIEGGGLTRIRVSDDGGGIAADQLHLAVARHATSKLAAVADLATVASLGFRGEALASIAAVSELRLRSRLSLADQGAEIRVRGTELIGHGITAMAAGTVVEACDLFVPTPARLAFLRGARAEAGAAVRVVADAALASPGIAMTCVNEGRTVLRSPGGGLDAALRAVLGERQAGELVAIEGAGEIAVAGRISRPHGHRGDRAQLVVVVNGRRVHNRALTVAIEDAYRGLLPAGRHPYGVVAVICDPARVDVNVHPTKREVRFRDERQVFAAVQRACWAALSESTVLARDGLFAASQSAAVTSAAAAGEGAGPGLRFADGEPPWRTEPHQPGIGPISPTPMAPTLAELAPLQPLGQAGAGWLLAASPRGAVVVDPHAAHEKVIYAELMTASAASAGAVPPSQLLLADCVVRVDAAALELVGDAELGRLGFEIEDFGPGLVRCRAIPAAARSNDPERLVQEALSAAGGEPGGRRHRLAALTACHAAVRLGDRLDAAEQRRLLQRLTATPGGITCPHGRPTVVLLDDAGLRRAFGRPVP